MQITHEIAAINLETNICVTKIIAISFSCIVNSTMGHLKSKLKEIQDDKKTIKYFK